jgi:hypothetical protein
MSRSRLALLLFVVGGCDISAKPFAGTVIQMTITTLTPTAPGRHLELWARNQYDDIIRVNVINDNHGDPNFPDGSPGLLIVKAATLDNPCIIDAFGNLLSSPAAYPKTVTVNGQVQTPDQQAATVRNRISQVSSSADCAPYLPPPNCGIEATPLLAMVPFDPTPAPTTCPETGTQPAGCIPGEADAPTRLAACNAFRAASPVTYVPNPAQFTFPLHGNWYGAVSYNVPAPPEAYDGIRLDSPVNLKGLRELFLTDEGPSVDPTMRGPTFLSGVPDVGGREAVHIDLIGPNASGTAALFVDLNSDPVQF